MHLAYFDENKFSDDNPFFLIGGLIIPEGKISEFEAELCTIQESFFGESILKKETELHGKEIFQGKGQFKGRNLSERVQLFSDVTSLLIENDIPIRIVCIDVLSHRQKYYKPDPEYQLGLMLILERFCSYLDRVDDRGLVFGDYESEQMTKSVREFSYYKTEGKTRYYYGRPLNNLIDTVYFTHSHHSRFLQVADMIIYMAQRYENGFDVVKWHDKQVISTWKELRAKADIIIQHWP